MGKKIKIVVIGKCKGRVWGFEIYWGNKGAGRDEIGENKYGVMLRGWMEG